MNNELSMSTCCTCGYTWPTGQHGGHSCTDQLLARVADQAREIDLAMREASDLAMTMWRTHYADNAPAFDLCDSLRGVISQIDNMYAGLRQELAALKQPSAGVDERKLITQAIGFEFEPGELQTVNADDLIRLVKAARVPIVCEFMPKCETCQGSGIIGHSEICPDCVETWQARAQLAAPAGVPDRVAMAKALCKHHSEQCGVDAGDQWKEYSQHFFTDVDVMLAAAPSTAPAADAPEDDQAYDRNAERLTAEALGVGAGINPNANSMADIFLDAPTLEPASDVVPVPRELSEAELLNSAELFVKETGRVSISAIQRKFKVDYWKACRAMEGLEVREVVSPIDSEGRRALLNGGRS